MASARWRAHPLRAALTAALLACLATQPAEALRIVNYNITNYPGTTGSVRNPHFRTVLTPLGADVVVVQEMQSQAGVDLFRDQVLNTLEPGQWASAPFTNGNDTDNAIFYKPSKVQFLGQWAWYPNPLTNLRYVNCYRLLPVGHSHESAELRLYSQHLKASSGSTNEAARLAEATGIRDSMNAVPPGTHCILLGDFNIYRSSEPAFVKFLESQADNDGRLFDPLNAVGTWNSPGFATIHTQCPCLTCPSGSGFSGGGLDDRFDMFLPTYNMNDAEGLDLVPGTYIPVGNDGLHYNLDINAAPVIPEGQAYADALWNASDHLPIRVDIQLPAQLSVPASLAFGTVITGATPTQDLTVTNTASPPADEAGYSLAAPAGFSAPAGALSVWPGTPVVSAIGMDTATPGNKAGTLEINTDVPATPSFNVSLSGTVLAHAQASLDSLAVVLEDTLDFGIHEPGQFPTLLAAVHNRGWNALQARLSVNTATIAGGDGRFTIAGFDQTLLSGTAGRWAVSFNDGGLANDTTVTATLTFESTDETLPGGTARPQVSYLLSAGFQSGAVAVGGPVAPGATRLYAPAPNPLAGFSAVRFDLATRGPVRLEVFDPGGRRVALLAAREFEPGRHSVRWDGRTEGGAAAGPGLYFVRLSAPGVGAQVARLAIVR